MKKLNRIIFFVIVMSICLISILSNKVYAVENTINEIKIEVNIKEDGIAEITETWNVEMYGISELYKPYYGLNISQIENFTVIDETNNRYEYVPDWDIDATREEKANKCGIYVNKEQGETDICWGVQKDGKHTYILKYNITNFIKQNMGYQTVNFKFLQSNMDPLPKKISVIVESENQFKEKEVIAKPKEEKIEKKKTDLEEKKKKSMSRLAQYPKITGSIEVIHANVFYINGRYVRLFGVDAPDNDQICSDAKGMSYNCGREAASWDVGRIDNNPIDCYLLQVNPNGVNVATCVWGEYDIGAGLVGAGWAIANTNETNIYAPYEAKAQANSYGLWAGTFYSPQDWRDIKSEQNNFVIKSKPKASGWFKSLF